MNRRVVRGIEAGGSKWVEDRRDPAQAELAGIRAADDVADVVREERAAQSAAVDPVVEQREGCEYQERPAGRKKRSGGTSRRAGLCGGPRVGRPFGSVCTLHRRIFYQPEEEFPPKDAAFPHTGRPAGVSLLVLLLFSVVACAEPPTTRAYLSSGLVFVRVVGDSNEIVRVRIADGEERSVTLTPDRDERWPYWSEKANRLLFQVGRPGDRNTSDLVLWNPVSQRESPLPPTPGREERWPGWSPDGRSIIYAFRGGVPGGGVALAFWRERRIKLVVGSTSNDFFMRPNFSPDGRLVVAQRRIAGQTGSSNLWVLSAEIGRASCRE
ncbi:MAG: PD40 domain-containing protein, partial [Deltaproteobacteria bacterium]|nr:PD40 domain-containing protein [Deltaproteobacteria bacterium]